MHAAQMFSDEYKIQSRNIHSNQLISSGRYAFQTDEIFNKCAFGNYSVLYL